MTLKRKLGLFAAAVVAFVLILPADLPRSRSYSTRIDNGPRGPDPPTDIIRIFRRSCFDCHSLYTNWPWYAHFAPLAWLLKRDVRAGRNALDLTGWEPESGAMEKQIDVGRLEAICAVLTANRMPPRRYILLHKDAALPAPAKERVCQWTKAEIIRVKSTP